MKLLFKRIAILCIRIIAPLFYNKKYLCGKYFDQRDIGWLWVLKGIWTQKILGFNRKIPWPITSNSIISNINNIYFHPDTINNFQSPGCYFQNSLAKIYICTGVTIAPNVGLITVNHDIDDLNTYTKGKNIVIGKNSWIGMNVVILPGTKLGKNTIVGAGSVVTKSFRQGNVVIAGNPAKIIKHLN